MIFVPVEHWDRDELPDQAIQGGSHYISTVVTSRQKQRGNSSVDNEAEFRY